jgi:hypothetical protein
MSFNIENLKKLNVVEPTNAALVSEAESKKLITAVASEANVTEDQAALALAIICQKGGTSKKAQGTIYAIVDGTKIDLNLVRRVMKDRTLNFTLRQFARTLATEIYTICAHFGIEGDLSKKIARNRPEITTDEKYWLSNFQMDNPNCPINVRELLMNHYESLFPGKKMDNQ